MMPASILSYSHPAFRLYVIALGQLTLMWNEFHEMLALLYCSVMGVRPGIAIDQHIAVWHALKVDRAQRDILLAAAINNILLDAPPTFINDIKWICERADVVEDVRNNAIHSPLFGIDYGEDGKIIAPSTSLGHVRAQSLAKKELLSEFRWCRDASNCLKEYVFAVHSAIFEGFSTPWPDRPAWPTRQDTNAKKQRLPTRPKGHPPQPPPSRE
jgi:hypothetical protein